MYSIWTTLRCKTLVRVQMDGKKISMYLIFVTTLEDKAH